jgi:cytochrome c oxidase cbb3-type subunit IV
MNWGVVSGLATVVAMIAFIGVVAYSYSSRRKADFERLSRVPLEEDRVS